MGNMASSDMVITSRYAVQAWPYPHSFKVKDSAYTFHSNNNCGDLNIKKCIIYHDVSTQPPNPMFNCFENEIHFCPVSTTWLASINACCRAQKSFSKINSLLQYHFCLVPCSKTTFSVLRSVCHRAPFLQSVQTRNAGAFESTLHWHVLEISFP